jgi:hypothetical protein
LYVFKTKKDLEDFLDCNNKDLKVIQEDEQVDDHGWSQIDVLFQHNPSGKYYSVGYNHQPSWGPDYTSLDFPLECPEVFPKEIKKFSW